MREGNKGVCMCVRVRERVEMEGGESAYMRVCESVCGEKGGESGVSKCVVGRFRGVYVYVIPSFCFLSLFRSSFSLIALIIIIKLVLVPYAVCSIQKHPRPQTHQKKKKGTGVFMAST